MDKWWFWKYIHTTFFLCWLCAKQSDRPHFFKRQFFTFEIRPYTIWPRPYTIWTLYYLDLILFGGSDLILFGPYTILDLILFRPPIWPDLATFWAIWPDLAISTLKPSIARRTDYYEGISATFIVFLIKLTHYPYLQLFRPTLYYLDLILFWPYTILDLILF